MTCIECGKPKSPKGVRCRPCADKRRFGPRALQAQAALVELKTLIVAARRRGDDNRAAELSAQKEVAKRRVYARCITCGVAIKQGCTYCYMHKIKHQFYSHSLPA